MIEGLHPYDTTTTKQIILQKKSLMMKSLELLCDTAVTKRIKNHVVASTQLLILPNNH